MTSGMLVFIILAIIAIAAAAGLILSRNTVYSALFLILNFLSVGAVYLVLGAPFIALAQITVYAGAIMVLFLFVIMLLGLEQLSKEEPLKWQRPLAIILAVGLVVEGSYAILARIGLQATTNPATSNLADPKTLANLLYVNYSLPFEITSIILLVAAIGAVVLTRVKPEERGN